MLTAAPADVTLLLPVLAIAFVKVLRTDLVFAANAADVFEFVVLRFTAAAEDAVDVAEVALPAIEVTVPTGAFDTAAPGGVAAAVGT